MRGGDQILSWLLAGDPAIRWQTQRDLLAAGRGTVERERRQVATQGWGARLLALQGPEGTWAHALYSPKWTSTTYTMLLLRDFGLAVPNPRADLACRVLLDRGFYRDGGISFGWERSETCVTAMVLSILSYFRYDDPRVDTVAGHLLDQQLPDGGWNCRRPRGATHASVHTTISALEGLHHYERHRRGERRAVREAQHRGREFLLVHRLFRSHRSGKVIDPTFTRLAFPPRWHYDILRALDYFRAAAAPRDDRLAEAVERLRAKRRGDGRWHLEHRHGSSRVFFELEQLHQPSRWNTLRALRVLRWWEGQQA